MQDVAYLDLCSHPTLPAGDRIDSQTDNDNDDGDNASICSSQVICHVKPSAHAKQD